MSSFLIRGTLHTVYRVHIQMSHRRFQRIQAKQSQFFQTSKQLNLSMWLFYVVPNSSAHCTRTGIFIFKTQLHAQSAILFDKLSLKSFLFQLNCECNRNTQTVVLFSRKLGVISLGDIWCVEKRVQNSKTTTVILCK